MSILTAIILGIIQGVAEFLPISSSGHLSILQNFFNMQTAEDGHMLFDVMLHLGTLVSVCIVYRKQIWAIICDSLLYLKDRSHPTPDNRGRKYPGLRVLVMMVIATLPLLLILPFHSKIEELYYSTGFIGAALIATGFILFFSDRYAKGNKDHATMTAVDALCIGLCQAVATVPGLSRSGCSIAGGVVRGLDRGYAAQFSFLISIPAILGANILNLFEAIGNGFDTSLLPAYFIGTVVAGVVGYFSVRLVQMLCQKGVFGKFSWYCWAAGFVTIVLTIVL